MDLRTARIAYETRLMVDRFEELLDEGFKPKEALKTVMKEFMYSYGATVTKIKPRQVLARRQRKAYEEKTLKPRREKAKKYAKTRIKNKPGRPRKKQSPEQLRIDSMLI